MADDIALVSLTESPLKLVLILTQPECQLSKPLWERNGLDISRFKLFRRILSNSGPVLRDTARLSQRYPPIARYGVFGVSTWPIGCDAPSPFSERFSLGWHAKWRCDTPPPLKKGISAVLARYPLKTRQMGAIPPSAIRSRKGIARYGGVSRTGPLSAHLLSCASRLPLARGIAPTAPGH